jgi:serine/threonine protein kinase
MKVLYGQALQLKSSERSAFLAQACGGNGQLLRQVESLLENRDKARAEGFLETPALAETVVSSWTGRRIAHYSVRERIGAGGMGEVYRAKDTKLGRDVAIKVLPPSLVQEADRRDRFEREARLLAALNHPHIAAIYGFEDIGEVSALVLELVEGPTLADRLKAGPLPLMEALRIARQIAQALEAAHEKDIIHRDLKPANIKITSNGTVKVLDFGLAKALGAGTTDVRSSQAPTQALGTHEGVILGTPAYMSPEQAIGQSESVDTRTDVWAFGGVLYEMLSGRLPFPGDSIPEMIAGVLGREPDWDALPDTVPHRVRGLLRRCLTKDPKQRMHSIANARIELDEVLSPAGTAAQTKSARTRGLMAGAASVLLVTALAAYFLSGTLNGPVSDPTEQSLTTNPIDDPVVSSAISLDGKYLVYNDSTSIRIRNIEHRGEVPDTVISSTSEGVPADFCFK